MVAMTREMLATLQDAEGFISGFEDDEGQVGVNELLERLRSLIAGVEVPPQRGAMTQDGMLFLEQADGTWTDGDLSFDSVNDLVGDEGVLVFEDVDVEFDDKPRLERLRAAIGWASAPV